MNETLKAVGHIGAELGAAKAENEAMREALRWYAEKVAECRKIGSLGDNARQALDLDGGFRARDAISKQAEPTDTYTAVEMATAAAQGFRDGQAAVEQAPAQDEREAFEARMRLGGYSNPEKHPDGSYVNSAMELWWQGWKAYAAWLRNRPAQTEQQPEQSEALAWKVLEAATDALDRRAAPHAWLSQTWEAGSKIITSRRAAMSTPPSPVTAPSHE